MIQELDTVVLQNDINEYGLIEGDIGAVVHCYQDAQAYEVDFVASEGKTIALLTLKREELRLMELQEILHVRSLAPIAA